MARGQVSAGLGCGWAKSGSEAPDRNLRHEYHSTRYPKEAKTRVAILLRAAAKVNAQLPAKQRKAAVHLRYMVFLAQELDTEAEKDQAIRDLVMAAFWGLARLGELTYEAPEGPIAKKNALLTTDVEILESEEGEEARLTLRNAKTCAPGATQLVRLKSMPNEMCPVAAVKRRLKNAKGNTTSLFGFYEGSPSRRRHLTRSENTLSLSRSQGVSPRARAHTWPELLGLAPIPLLAVPFSLGGVSRPLEEFPSSGPGQTSIHHPLDPYPADSGARPIESQAGVLQTSWDNDAIPSSD
ncbi:hypothetical protein PCASD_06549 [Puccinia coronata f. sp. avenae]|uniref:Uncharacterized protein n=1 Tax=Puccinia coronata f. sp. avenae TaxID=200324 RepID=A0A2N5TFT4_9BASI|nr:hypothetical protein PCASD_06549 [Puccinia coronata f. sp. avenae]